MSKSKKQNCCMPWFVYIQVGLLCGFSSIGLSSFYSSHNFQFVWPLNWPLVITDVNQPDTTQSADATPAPEDRYTHVQVGSRVLVWRSYDNSSTVKKCWGKITDYDYIHKGVNFPYTVTFSDGEGVPYAVGEFIELEQVNPFNATVEPIL
jgi:hypothetical protein